jgi:hypothetical protein
MEQEEGETMEPVEKPLSASQIIAAVEHLSLRELDEVADRVLTLRATRRAPHICDEETALLKRISQTLPEDLKTRLHVLITKRDTEELTEAEYTELASLTDRLEVLHADRMAALGTLAQHRGTALDEVMHQLGVHLPDHD